MQIARTTIELDKELLKKTKQKALEEDKSLKQIIHEALEKIVIAGDTKRPKIKTQLKKYPFRAYHLGKIKGNLSREEIYDWL